MTIWDWFVASTPNTQSQRNAGHIRVRLCTQLGKVVASLYSFNVLLENGCFTFSDRAFLHEFRKTRRVFPQPRARGGKTSQYAQAKGFGHIIFIVSV